MAERRVAVFFYGSFMDRALLAARGYAPTDLAVARLPAFDIRFTPLATLAPAGPRTSVYGLLATATHAELERLYGEGWVSSYRPEAVIVRTGAGKRLPALVYIAWGPTPPPPSDSYIQHVLGPAREHRFPARYIEHIERRWAERP
ncbi:MAG TPA: gamma-glutamylcyclotransferase family protein [Gemmatimonadales bacterium]|nr:gamma-glutamylcyclotransferase family protein [Gemmatimonadales bacterium]